MGLFSQIATFLPFSYHCLSASLSSVKVERGRKQMQMSVTERSAEQAMADPAMTRRDEVRFGVVSGRTGVRFNVRIVAPGQMRRGQLSGGQIRGGTSEDVNATGETLIEFFDARAGGVVDTQHRPLGTFITRLRLDAMLADDCFVCGRDGLDLHSHVVDWNLDRPATQTLHLRLMQLGYVELPSLLAA